MSMILRRIVNKLQGISYQTLKYSTTVENKKNIEDAVPIISRIQYHDENTLYQNFRQVWLENLDTIQEKKLGLVTLHPQIYAAAPRIDIIHQNVKWQKLYRYVVSKMHCTAFCVLNYIISMYVLYSSP